MRRWILAWVLMSLLGPGQSPAAGDERAQPPDPAGTWRGELDRGEQPGAKPLQIVLRVTKENGAYSATLDGLGANLRNLKPENFILIEDVLSFRVPAVGRFAGNFYGDSLRGTWTEGEESWSLILFRD